MTPDTYIQQLLNCCSATVRLFRITKYGSLPWSLRLSCIGFAVHSDGWDYLRLCARYGPSLVYGRSPQVRGREEREERRERRYDRVGHRVADVVTCVCVCVYVYESHSNTTCTTDTLYSFLSLRSSPTLPLSSSRPQ